VKCCKNNKISHLCWKCSSEEYDAEISTGVSHQHPADPETSMGSPVDRHYCSKYSLTAASTNKKTRNYLCVKKRQRKGRREGEEGKESRQAIFTLISTFPA
jgi:hypothetical protein